MSGIWKGKRKYYQAWWTNAEGEREQGSTGRTTKKAAVAWLRDRELEASVRGLPAFTVGRALELAGKKQVRRKNTKGTIDAALNRADHVARVLGEGADLHAPGDKKGVDALLTKLGGDFMDQRRTEQVRVKGSSRLTSDGEIRKELVLFGSGLREAVRLGEYVGNPVVLIPEELGTDRVREHCPKVDHFDALCGRATTHRRRWLILYADTGADVSELHKAQREEDVNLDTEPHGEVFLRGTKTRRHHDKRERWVPLSARARQIVDELIEIPDEGRHSSRVGMLMPAYWDSSSFGKTVHPWCDELGIPHIIVKDLRRYYCTRLRDAGVPESDVYGLLGHSDSRMLRKIYDRGKNERVYAQVADALSGSANMRHDNVVPIGKASELGELDSDAAEEKA
jgi:integrase